MCAWRGLGVCAARWAEGALVEQYGSDTHCAVGCCAQASGCSAKASATSQIRRLGGSSEARRR